MVRTDSARLDNRSRGNAAQQLERYKSLARDATQSGDRITAEYYHQYADHYFRVLNENRPRYEDQRPQQGRDWQERDAYQDGDDTDYARDDDRGQADQAGYPGRVDGERDPRSGDGTYERNSRNEARPREDRPQARDDRGRDDRPRDDRPRDSRSQERPRDDRYAADRPSRDTQARDDRPRDDRPREERPREERQANRDQRPRRERWNGQQGGAEPTDPPVPTREPVVEREQIERGAEPLDAGAPRKARTARAARPEAGDDPFAVRRPPEPTVESVTIASEPSDEAAAPVRRRRTRKAEPGNDAELSLESA